MGEIAGILYPETLQPGRAIQQLLAPSQYLASAEALVFEHKNLQLGSIDASHYQDEEERLWLALNGEVSNKETLSRQLTALGYTVNPHDPAALIACAYCAWGKSFMEKLEGEFLIVLYDRDEEELLLIRDRLGRYPLYWHHGNKYFLFCTSLKGLIHSGLVPPEPAKDGFAAFLFFSFFPQDFTPIKDVNKLLPSYFLSLHLSGNKLIRPYWSYSSFYEKSRETQEADFLHSTHHLLRVGMEQRLKAGQPVACIWDGSLSSVLTACLLSEGKEQDRHLYTLGAFSQGYRQVQEIEKGLGLQPHILPFDAKTWIEQLPALVWSLDEPIGSLDLLWHAPLAQHLKAQDHQLLASVGCTELLAGANRLFERPRHYSLFSFLNKLPYPLIKHAIVPLAGLFSQRLPYAIWRHYYTTPLQGQYVREHALLDEDAMRDLAPLLSQSFDADVFLHKFHHLGKIVNETSELMYFDSKTRLPDLELLEHHRMYQTWQSPFLHTPLAEYLAGVPCQLKFSANGKATALEGLIQSYLPGLSRQESLPRQAILQNLLLPEDIQHLLEGQLVAAGLIHRASLARLIRAYRKRRQGLRPLWALLILEIWYRLYLRAPMHTRPPSTSLGDFLGGRPTWH